jgi:SAM-dependent methyltransferase
VEDVVASGEAPTPAVAPSQGVRCRLCGEPLSRTFVDLGVSPLANSYLEPEDLLRAEIFYPLRVYVCEACLLTQLPAFAAPEDIFGDYAYFSSYSDTWVDHARAYVVSMIERYGYDSESLVVEIASNDGYLLQFFVAAGVPVLGIEPAANVAAAARERGIPTLVEFFGTALGDRLRGEGRQADLVVGNNVLAHVPDPHDLVEGIRWLVKPGGIVTMEFPHLLRLISERQLDTIYHEHFSYFSLLTAERLFAGHGLPIFDVEELQTHGGSLRVFAAPIEAGREASGRLIGLRERELQAGLHGLDGYLDFDRQCAGLKLDLLSFLISAKREGKQVAGYGAPAKATTLLNYCGVRTDLIEYVVDRSPHKQGRFLPGTRIPIYGPEHIRETRPDLLLILPWNLADEVMEQMADVRDWGCRFVVPVPHVVIR